MSSGQANSGIGLPSLLLVLFVGLKLTGFIDWSWWWVTSPIWITAAIVFPIVLVAAWLQALRDAKRVRRF